MRSASLFRAASLLALLALLFPAIAAGALAPAALPPADMFQLPWDQGVSWMAIDGLDNGANRPTNSSHNYLLGGAIDFAPHKNTIVGEDTSTFWVTAAAAGTVSEITNCSLKIDHGNGWVTDYQFLGNIQVKLGNSVARNQRLAVIADGLRQRFCLPDTNPEVPHLHFALRSSIRNATFAGWVVNYDPLFNKTTFTKNGQTLGLFQLLSNTPGATSTGTPTPTPTPPSGPFVSTVVSPAIINPGASTTATVSLNNIPVEGYTSTEFTCTYNAGLAEVSNIVIGGLFGSDPVTAINGPQNGSFIVAIAGSNGSKATSAGPAFTFNLKGLQTGQTTIECKARASKGDGTLTSLTSLPSSLNILTNTATPTATVITPGVTSPATSTATPTRTLTPNPGITTTLTATATATATVTATASPTATPLSVAILSGQVSAGKPVSIGLYNLDNSLATSVAAGPNGAFSLSAPAGSYNVVASVNGFLGAKGAVALTIGTTRTMTTISLLAGDIDNNNVIDQFDALTIGMNYNAATPATADLNGDGTINILDLELLARNYRKTGPLPWQ